MIRYVARWNPKNEKNTWSGTTYFLYRALNKKTKIERLDAPNPSLVRRVISKLTKIPLNYNFQYMNQVSKKLSKKINYDDKVLQIGDLVNESQTYIYQDMSFSLLKELKTNDFQTYNYSGFKFDNDRLFEKRLEFQESIYDSDTTIFTMSHWFQDFLKSTGKTNVIYVGGGINTPTKTHSNTPRQKKTILFVGRDFYRKGGKIVVEAFKILYRTDSSVRLIIAGPEREPIECHNIAGIKFLGAVNYDTVAHLMQTSSVFAMPSYFEAYGLVFLEAMANGLPILARDKFEMPYFVQRGSGLIINSGDTTDEVQQTASQLKKILTDSSFLSNAQQKAQSIRDEFSWDTVAHRILSVMN